MLLMQISINVILPLVAAHIAAVLPSCPIIFRLAPFLMSNFVALSNPKIENTMFFKAFFATTTKMIT